MVHRPRPTTKIRPLLLSIRLPHRLRPCLTPRLCPEVTRAWIVGMVTKRGPMGAALARSHGCVFVFSTFLYLIESATSGLRLAATSRHSRKHHIVQAVN